MRPGRLVLVVLTCLSCGEARPSSSSTLERFAGDWQVSAQRESGDTVVGFRLMATADAAGWSLQFPGRDPVPVHIVKATGDSVIAEAAPYESVLRPGVQVRTSLALRLRDGSLEGATVARYSVAGPDSVLRLRNSGRRLP